MPDLTGTLVAALTSQGDRTAEDTLQEWCGSNYGEFAKALAIEIASVDKPLESRQMASIYLKNTLYAKSAALQKEKHNTWKTLDGAIRTVVKDALLSAIRATPTTPEMQRIPHFAAVAAAEIASVELPYQEWTNFIPSLTENISGTITVQDGDVTTNVQVTEVTQLASLECLGFTCERIAEIEELMPDEIANNNIPELPVTIVDKMLTTIVDGVQPDKNSDNKRFAALTALKNSLTFVRKNMEVKQERDFIINNAVCEAARCQTDARVRQLAFACLDQICEYYYEVLTDYMSLIYQLTITAISGDPDEDVRMAAIEFWSTMAYVEQNLLDEENALREEQLPLDRPPCKKYVESAMNNLVPLLLETLSRLKTPATANGNAVIPPDDQEDDDDEWNLRSAGAVCLESISQAVEGLIVPVVMPFVQQHIVNSEDWRLRDAAILAFSCILDGPGTDVIGEYVRQSIPVLLASIKDATSSTVRDSATHCLSIILRMHIAAIQHDQIHNILSGLLEKLQEKPRLASHACSAIFNVAYSIKTQQQLNIANGTNGEQMEATNLLSIPMYPLIDGLLKTCDREDSVEANLRVAAMSAASELVCASAVDTQPVLRELLPAITERIEKAFQAEMVSKDEVEIREQLLGLLCGLLGSLFQRLSKRDLLPHGDRVMQVLLQVLQVPNATCHEEALLAIGTIAGALEEDFTKYLEAFKPFLVTGLRAVQVKSLCMVAIGVVVDLCTAVGGHIQPMCDDIMAALMDCLKDASVHRDVKPVVIAAFGDIAMAICGKYEPYFQVSTMLLMQAAQQQAPPDNEDLIAFINSLRVAILEAYSGILIGLSDGNALHLFAPNVQNILSFLQYLSTPASNRDDEVLQRAISVVGDIAQQMGGSVASGGDNTSQQQQIQLLRQQISQPFVAQLIQEGSNHPDEATRSTAAWAAQHVQSLM